MREICEERRVACDIEWTEDKRIYGANWLDFTARCKTTLGAESGSNVFDFDGSLTRRCNTFLKKNPDVTYEEFHGKCIGDLEMEGLMNQVSPRVFEAISMRTGLILFEGEYSGVVQPYEHYIPLRKDFSNIDEVLARVYDDDYLEGMIDRAYDHVVGSGKYTYEKFVQYVESYFEPKLKNATPPELVGCLIGGMTSGAGSVQLFDGKIFTKPLYYKEIAEYHTSLPEVPAPPPAPCEIDFDEKILITPTAWSCPALQVLCAEASFGSVNQDEGGFFLTVETLDLGSWQPSESPPLVLDYRFVGEEYGEEGPEPTREDLVLAQQEAEPAPVVESGPVLLPISHAIEEVRGEASDGSEAINLNYVVRRQFVWPNLFRVKQAIKALCFEYREEAA